MFGFLTKVKDYVAHNVGDIASKVKHEVNEFLEENKKLEEKEKLDEKRQKEAKLPWDNVKILHHGNSNIRDIIKEEILELSAHEDNFLTEDSTYMFEFDFNMEDFKYEAIKIMEYDERLGILRNQLVPSKISDEKFWRNYFYNVELIKMKHAIKAEEEAERTGGHGYDEDEVLKSEEDEQVVLHSKEKKEVRDHHNTSGSTNDKSKIFDIEHENENDHPEIDIKI